MSHPMTGESAGRALAPTTCGVYWRGERVCPLNTDRLWNAGHECAGALGHAGRCRCACGTER